MKERCRFAFARVVTGLCPVQAKHGLAFDLIAAIHETP
jgi:hypothetical protein